MDYVPVLPLFETPGKQAEYSNLEKYFKTKYGHLPSFYVRAPGRVNLIGEHIDYCGFAVFPMAIEQDIVLAVGVNSNNLLNISNVETSIYEDFATPTDVLQIDQAHPKWYHYVMCGFRGVIEECLVRSTGLDIAVQGTVPPSSGLSSSSALVCAAALATAHANRITITKIKFASLCAKCERYIGTQGGGMDQAISFLAEPGSAKLIEFNPLQSTNVPLPKGASFVVANSCVLMNKASTAHYNVRVVECKLAAKLLASLHQLEWRIVEKLGDLPKLLSLSLSAMPSVVNDLLHREPYTRTEICSLLSISENELVSLFLTKNTAHLMEFKLHQRALHVFQEGHRVWQFKEICEKLSGSSLKDLGELMNESHTSCRDLYECSHPDLDELVNVSLQAGALGSRLTGAGWGGCCVSLVKTEHCSRFIQEVEQNFYNKSSYRKQMLKNSLFVTQPGGGALIYTV